VHNYIDIGNQIPPPLPRLRVVPTLPSGPGSAPEGLMPRREALLGRRQKGGIPLFGILFLALDRQRGGDFLKNMSTQLWTP
jgi:hypothetical protein